MAKYVPLVSPDKKHVVMMKTTTASPANADWDSVDGSVLVNRLGHSDQNLIASMWAFEHSSDIYVATQQDYGRVALHVFDPGTDTWTTRDESAEPTGDYFPTTTENLAVSISVRSDGDVLIGYKEASGTGSIRSLELEAGVWTDISIGTSRTGGCVYTAPDSANRITTINQTATGTVRTKSISSSNSTIAEVGVDASSFSAAYILGSPVITSDQIYVPYIDASGVVGIADWASAASPTGITLTAATTNLVDTSTDTQLKLGLALDGTDLHLFYIRDTDDDIYHDQDTGGGWGTDTSEITGAGAIGALSVNKLTSVIGIIYLDGTATKFDVYELAVAGSPIPIFDYHYRHHIG